ncbi:MAG: lysoplasmalogenase family protein [Parasphingorhabdus sp.]|nr:lysoplasmalogenase family protein [Parasphingorhabdus sp.]
MWLAPRACSSRSSGPRAFGRADVSLALRAVARDGRSRRGSPGRPRDRSPAARVAAQAGGSSDLRRDGPPRGRPGNGVRRVMFAGLVLAATGDVLLIPKSKRFFLFGLVAFLLGHVGYAVAFVVRGVDPVATACAALLLGLVAIPIPSLAVAPRGGAHAHPRHGLRGRHHGHGRAGRRHRPA